MHLPTKSQGFSQRSLWSLPSGNLEIVSGVRENTRDVGMTFPTPSSSEARVEEDSDVTSWSEGKIEEKRLLTSYLGDKKLKKNKKSCCEGQFLSPAFSVEKLVNFHSLAMLGFFVSKRLYVDSVFPQHHLGPFSKYSHLCISGGAWIENPSWIPKAMDAQVFYIKWPSTVPQMQGFCMHVYRGLTVFNTTVRVYIPAVSRL